MTKEEVSIQIHKGPYWWPTIVLNIEHVHNECETCQILAILSQDEKTHDWRKPIIQHLKHPMELGNSAFHKDLGILHEE